MVSVPFGDRSPTTIALSGKRLQGITVMASEK
jgi:hypothetical protein